MRPSLLIAHCLWLAKASRADSARPPRHRQKLGYRLALFYRVRGARGSVDRTDRSSSTSRPIPNRDIARPRSTSATLRWWRWSTARWPP